MSHIEIEQHKLKSRGNEIQRILRPISKTKSGPAWYIKRFSSNFVIGTNDGAPPSSDFRAWRFATTVPLLRAGYYEIWRQFDSGQFCLEQAYLHIYETNPRIKFEQEILALHCDPNQSTDEKNHVYKRGPHLHVSKAEHPLPKAHIALNRCHLNEVLASIENLTEALRLALLMVREEFIDIMNG